MTKIEYSDKVLFYSKAKAYRLILEPTHTSIINNTVLTTPANIIDFVNHEYLADKETAEKMRKTKFFGDYYFENPEIKPEKEVVAITQGVSSTGTVNRK